jgi:insulysin
MAETLDAMDTTEFHQHVEALAQNILEKPKRMSQRNGRYWSEIMCKQYNFDRDEVEVG